MEFKKGSIEEAAKIILESSMEYLHPTLKRVTVRAKGRVTSVDNKNLKPSEYPVIGWFANKYNRSGWSIHKLSDYDEKWLKGEGVKTKGVFKTSSGKGNESIAKIDIKKGTYAFMDNDHLEKTDEVRFEKMAAYSDVFLDAESHIDNF